GLNSTSRATELPAMTPAIAAPMIILFALCICAKHGANHTPRSAFAPARTARIHHLTPEVFTPQEFTITPTTLPCEFRALRTRSKTENQFTNEKERKRNR